MKVIGFGSCHFSVLSVTIGESPLPRASFWKENSSRASGPFGVQAKAAARQLWRYLRPTFPCITGSPGSDKEMRDLLSRLFSVCYTVTFLCRFPCLFRPNAFPGDLHPVLADFPPCNALRLPILPSNRRILSMYGGLRGYFVFTTIVFVPLSTFLP